MKNINLGKQSPKGYEALMALSARTEEGAVAAGLDPKLIELVKIRSSQLNGCAFCLRMHVRDAVAAGETSDRLAVIAAWWESQYFSPAEQEALQIAEDITRIGDQRTVPHLGAEGTTLTDQQAAAVAWVAVTINAWNRVAIASHYPVAP